MVTLDFWSQEMFLDANGQKTVTEYLTVLINQISGKQNGNSWRFR